MDNENDFYKLWMLGKCGISVQQHKVFTPLYPPTIEPPTFWEVKRSQIIEERKRNISLRNKFIRLGLASFVALSTVAVCAITAIIFKEGSSILGFGYGMASIVIYFYLSDFFPTQLWQIKIYRKGKRKNHPAQ